MRRRDKLTVIEFNPRMAAQFSDLYLRVDGVDLHRVALELALGRDPARLPRAEPSAGAAASFVYRCFDPADAPAMPGAAQQAALADIFPMRCCSALPNHRGRLPAISSGWAAIVTASCILAAGMHAICRSGARKPVNCSVGRHLMRSIRRKPTCRPAIQHPIFPWRFLDVFSLDDFLADRTARSISAEWLRRSDRPESFREIHAGERGR